MPLEDRPEPGQHQPDQQPADSRPSTQMRKVTDAHSLRALAHPVRVLLMEALGMHGAMTATEVGERIGESPTTCSFHLRQLARYGFVEEAGGGKGRARPWRIAAQGLHLSSTPGDAESELAAEHLRQIISARQNARYANWRATRSSYPPEWRKVASTSEHLIYLTADELSQLNADFHAMVDDRFGHRYYNPQERPGGSLPVEILLVTYPTEPPGGDSRSTQTSTTAEPPAADQEGE
jgi:DNA-binding transcriptional ArsR family regulator